MEFDLIDSLVVPKNVKVKRPLPQKYPWPRCALDDSSVKLGVDVQAKQKDIIKLVHKFFHVDGIHMEELLQEVYAAICHKNFTKSAHDPRKSSFGHYVYMVANNVCINLVHKKKRYDKEKEMTYESMEEDESGHTQEEVEQEDKTNDAESESETIAALESSLRKSGELDLARYVCAVRTGAPPDILREALTYGKKVISLKYIRDVRKEVVEYVRNHEV